MHSFIVYVEIENIYSGIAKDVEAKLDTSSYELDRTLPKGKNKKIIGLLKDYFGGKIMKKLRPKT